MIQVRILASKLLKAKEVRRLCQNFFAGAKTEECIREVEEYDKYIRNVIAVNKPFLQCDVKKRKTASTPTLTA